MVDVVWCTYYRYAVAILQMQGVSGKELDVATHHAADVYPIDLSHVERTEGLAVQLRACHHHHTALHRGVDGIPVDMVAVPVLFHPLAEEHLHGRHLVAPCHHEHVVARLDNSGGIGNDDVIATPDTRHDEVVVGHLRHLSQRLAGNGRIYHHELTDKGLVFIICIVRLQVVGSDEELAQQYHSENHSHYTEGICNGASQGSTATRQVCIGQSLLGSSQGWGVGGGSAEYSHHIRHADRQHEAQRECHHRAQGYQRHAPRIERHAVMTHHADKVGTYMKAERIYKQRQAERLGKIQHLWGCREMQTTCHDADEEDKCHTKGYSSDVDLAEG